MGVPTRTRTLKDAVALVRQAPPVSKPAITAELERLETLRKSLLPIERNAATAVETEERRLRSQLTTSDVPYPVFDLDPLRWRNKQGLPQFALFSIASHTVRIESDQGLLSGGGQILTPLPQKLADCYLDVFKRLKPSSWLDKFGFRWGVGVGAVAGIITAVCVYGKGDPAVGLLAAAGILVGVPLVGGLLIGHVFHDQDTVAFIEAQYTGVIPDSVRAKITQAKEVFGEGIYILSEVEEWRVGRGVRATVDPLVLGFKGGVLYLIDQYDTTPLEEFARREFSR